MGIEYRTFRFGVQCSTTTPLLSPHPDSVLRLPLTQYLTCLFVGLFKLKFSVPAISFELCRDGSIASWVLAKYFGKLICLVHGHNPAPRVGIEPRTSRFGFRCSSTRAFAPLQNPIVWSRPGPTIRISVGQ